MVVERGVGLLYRGGIPDSENVTYGFSFYPDGVDPATREELAEFGAEPIRTYKGITLDKVAKVHELIVGYRGEESELLRHIDNVLKD